MLAFPIAFGKKPIPNDAKQYVGRLKLEQEQLSCACEAEKCDTFQFMSRKLGIEVLHPGGLQATKQMVEKCKISRDMIVLDAGCGRGTSSIFLARQYGCRVVGVDTDPTSLVKAHEKAHKKNVLDKVAFRLEDLNSLSLQDNTFDGAIFQASLIFCDKARVLRAVNRKIRSGGFLGVIELAWKVPPPADVKAIVKDILCAAAVNVELHNGWIALFEKAGFDVESSEVHDLDFGFRSMLVNEGFLSTLRIASKCVFKQEARDKTRAIANLFKETGAYLGFGIYSSRKPDN
jgi:SAM-dependent methyltransferase